MARKSIMISFDPVAFRDVVSDHGKALSDLESVTGVTKQAINGWLTSSRIPPRQLHTIAQGLKWKAGDLERVLKKAQSQNIRFRTHRNTLATKDAEETAHRLAVDFFSLDAIGGEYNKESFVLRVGKDASASAVAEGLLRQLSLKRGQFGLEELILSLARTNISVVFIDFGHHFSLDEKAAKNLKAFCAKQGQRYLIAIDSRMKSEDVTWAIFHELAHIACGDIDEGTKGLLGDTKAEEKFRNEVASEVLTPTDHLLACKDDLKKYLGCQLRLLPSRVEHLASELGASFVGVLLALEKIEAISPQAKNYLWAVHHRRDQTRLSVKDLIFPRTVQTRDELLATWDNRLNTESLQHFLKLQLLVRQGIIENRISTSRAAELIGIETGEMEELANHWAAEVSGEAAH